jgi:hypothetical protein
MFNTCTLYVTMVDFSLLKSRLRNFRLGRQNLDQLRNRHFALKIAIFVQCNKEKCMQTIEHHEHNC